MVVRFLHPASQGITSHSTDCFQVRPFAVPLLTWVLWNVAINSCDTHSVWARPWKWIFKQILKSEPWIWHFGSYSSRLAWDLLSNLAWKKLWWARILVSTHMESIFALLPKLEEQTSRIPQKLFSVEGISLYFPQNRTEVWLSESS